MSIPLVDLKAQYHRIKDEIDTAVHHILDNTAFIMGKPVAEFEANFAKYAHAKHAIGVASGTDALKIAMEAWGLGAGDEVITTPHTFIATVEPMMQLGIKPVFVDIDPATYNINPDLIEAAITDKTKAIVPVHLYGQPANMPAIAAIAEKHGLDIIEDCAQAHGAEVDGVRVGHWGKISGFSFYPGKNLGAAGDAGGIITDIDDTAELMRRILNHGSKTKYEHTEIGYTARLDAMQAAILDVKLRHIEQWTDERRANAKYYDQILADVDGVTIPYHAPNVRHVYHLYVIRVPEGTRQEVLQYLWDNGVGAGIHYPIALHMQPAMASLGYKEGDFPEAEAAAANIISLPMFPELTHEQMDTVVATLKEALKVHA
jgi:dTDP-4-amino-4,6-dideoxygalactose transaminase